MHDAHREVATLLRPETDLKSYFGWLALGQFVMAFFFTLLCARYVPSRRAGAGAMLGLLVGLMCAGPHLISFAVQPLTFKILCGWIAGAVINSQSQAQSSAPSTNRRLRTSYVKGGRADRLEPTSLDLNSELGVGR